MGHIFEISIRSFSIALCWRRYLVICILFLLQAAASPVFCQEPGYHEITIATWNIWHGGRENGDSIGPLQIAKLLQESNADLIALQETYGSGEFLASQLQCHFHPRGTNVSILSRYPIVEDVSVFLPFHCVGAVISLPGRQQIAFYSIWLSYNEDIWVEGIRDSLSTADMLAGTGISGEQMKTLLSAIHSRLDSSAYAAIPVLIAGDFNAMSHLDYTDENIGQYGFVVEWPTSLQLVQQGFADAYRQHFPTVERMRDRTWSPRFPDQEQDRIDYIYFRGENMRLKQAGLVDSCGGLFPSDHAMVWARFGIEN
jgi:endonuclease/exonuclease/phosphatase family metal-dependent hydrolase